MLNKRTTISLLIQPSFLLIYMLHVCHKDLFRLGGLFSITDDVIFSRELFFYPSKNYLFIHTWPFENWKGQILKSIITWSEMEQQTAHWERSIDLLRDTLLPPQTWNHGSKSAELYFHFPSLFFKTSIFRDSKYNSPYFPRPWRIFALPISWPVAPCHGIIGSLTKQLHRSISNRPWRGCKASDSHYSSLWSVL